MVRLDVMFSMTTGKDKYRAWKKVVICFWNVTGLVSTLNVLSALILVGLKQGEGKEHIL
jgi:hypothetical protein